MKTLVCLLEEPSAKVMLEIILPKIVSKDIILGTYIVFEGKPGFRKEH